MIYQLRVTYGVQHTRISEDTLTLNLQPMSYVVACVLFSKLQDVMWHIVHSRHNSGEHYVYMKMCNRDLVRFYGKMYEWNNGTCVTFCMVHTILPILPTDHMDKHQVVKI
jgi:hypothetical protein